MLQRKTEPAPPETQPQPAESGITVQDVGSGRTLTLRGKILTAPEGPLDMGEAVRDLCALSEDGQFLVSRSHISNGKVLSCKARARQLGFRISETIPVDLATLKIVYEKAGEVRSFTRGMRDDTRMQREILDIIARAAQHNASDIHIALRGRTATVELGVTGQLESGQLIGLPELQPDHARELMSATFAMADSSGATYQPLACQNARLTNTEEIELPSIVQAVRVAWSPLAQNGRYMVMRLFYHGQKETSDLDALGYSRGQLKLIKFMRTRPYGINIFSGPTGAGKSTTLFCSIKALHKETRGKKNIITVENPVEYIIDGTKQISVNADRLENLESAFAEAIRIALRQAPRILMIGEVRDPPSAQLAMDGAETGHGIWTSIHTSSALGILTRLLDLEVRPDKVFDASLVTGLAGQRLVPMLCPSCRVPLEKALAQGIIDPDLHARTHDLLKKIGRDADGIYVANPKGCEKCTQDGVRGRTVCAEVITPDETLMDLMREGNKAKARAYWLNDLNGATMLAHGIAKMLQGVIGPAELEANVDVIRHEPFMNRIFKGGRIDDIVF